MTSGLIVYVGTGGTSRTSTFSLTANIVPLVDPDLSAIVYDSVPSTRVSMTVVLVIVAVPSITLILPVVTESEKSFTLTPLAPLGVSVDQ